MKPFLRLVLPALTLIGTVNSVSAQKKIDNTPLVNVFVGTAGQGHTYPGAAVPFGMVQLSPDTRSGAKDSTSGYNYADTVVYGFSHTHMSGAGVSAFGDILLMPTTGEPKLLNTEYRSNFKKKNEGGSPGYYKTRLEKYAVDVELTATKRVGVHHYTYPKTSQANIIIDLQHRGQVQDAWIEMVSNHEIRGFRRSTAEGGDQYVYFYAKFSRPFKTYGIALDDQVQQGKTKLQGKNVKMFLQFDNPGEVIAKVGLSSVSAEGALKNLDAEVPDFDFKKIQKDARTEWLNQLAKIQVEGGAASSAYNNPYGAYNPYNAYPRSVGQRGKQVVVDYGKQKRTIFYTALYHSLLSPNIYNDVDGQYRGIDQKVHNANGFNYYTGFLLWNTYRAQLPLLALVDQKRTLDFVKTFLAMYDDGRLLPVGPVGTAETYYMGGNHAIPVIADAYAKGIKDFNTDKALRAMKEAANRNQVGLEQYRKNGFVPATEPASVTKTLDYAFDDWCIAQFAKALNKQPDYNEFTQRAQYWKNIYNNQSGFMQARANGGWYTPFDAAEVNDAYAGSNAWPYAFAVPQDEEGLVNQMGGKDKFEAKLDEFFNTRPKTENDGVGQYQQGNEAAQHLAYLYNFTDDPTKAQLYLSKIVKKYGDGPEGLPGNEGGGQLSAWYVMSALGIYSVTPGQQQFQIGLPQFDKTVISLENGKKFTITNTAVSQANIYLQGMNLDKKPYSKLYLNYDDISKGGDFEYYAGRLPNRLFVQDLEKPASGITDNQIVANPYFVYPAASFKDNITMEIKSTDTGTQIYYTVDGSTPTAGSRLYTGPLSVAATTTVKAIAIKDGKQSFVTEGKFVKE